VTTHPNQFTAQKRNDYLAQVEEERKLARLQDEVCGPFNPSKATSGWLVAANPKKAEKATRSA